MMADLLSIAKGAICIPPRNGFPENWVQGLLEIDSSSVAVVETSNLRDHEWIGGFENLSPTFRKQHE
jgi:hypothetical protein